jgi:hypothetical protein
MKKEGWSVGLWFLAFAMWFFPSWNGLFVDPSGISLGEGRIVSAIFLVGGLILFYLPKQNK